MALLNSQQISKPLAGYRVLDLTTFLSGPYCTQILGDLGADVVKVEAPDGDSSRSIPPHFVDGDSAYYLANNRNKRSISVDLKEAKGIELVRRLIAEVDVVVENYRPGVASRLGLDPQRMTTDHSRLIWASISGFGQHSPWKDRPAYDMIVQALSGVMSLTGERNSTKSVRLGIPAGDTVAGLYAAIAVNAALADRERTGAGRLIDVSMLDCQLSMLSYQSAYTLIADVTPGHQGASHDSIPTYRSFLAGDGREVVITANTARMWRGLCSAIGQPALANDPRFDDGGKRLENRQALWDILEPAFLARSAAEWVDVLNENDVPCALIKLVPEALADARESGRDMVVSMRNASGKEIEVVGNPVHFTGGTREAPNYPPSLGGDASSVLGEWLQMGDEEVASLAKAGVLRTAAQSQ
ncbi:CaiB/BaiF CoA transferase family protein [Pseudoprimorskyibacter insulae]|uniref:Acetyl-CoA:oxalate CoA-transferase n=1 Tax=Pseudoprimorskyibacter insulae TaxID=1695997 RepID=A0A2R8AZR4_9RHOB|nr:CoA transferase [Pseudoprimorskyibacter insulae]SPF81516.1 Acetyl-CoA:oxalate CoA-transferase [Pseudoprimorskyibacter insulae]